VHNNVIDVSNGGTIGGIILSGDNGLCSTSSGNYFHNNQYILPAGSSTPFLWCGAKVDASGWQNLGMS
jgi:hypothetical protein